MIALPAPLATELREHHQAQTAEQVAAGSLWRGGGWVFASEVGGPTDPRKDHRDWVDLLNRAGVRAARLHDARLLTVVSDADGRVV